MLAAAPGAAGHFPKECFTRRFVASGCWKKWLRNGSQIDLNWVPQGRAGMNFGTVHFCVYSNLLRVALRGPMRVTLRVALSPLSLLVLFRYIR